jgi:molybdopterin molybdotransferase
MGIVGDRPEDIAEIMIKALAHSDLVISSGGVSVGDYDYVDRVLADLGANIQIKSCAIKPGKPLTVASFNHKIYFGIPGNPASLMVCFSRLIKGAIAKLSGANSAYWYPQYIQAIALDDLHAQGRRETYLWGFVTANHNHWQFQPISNHISGYSSGNLISWAGVNALAILKVNQTYIPRGEIALVLML